MCHEFCLRQAAQACLDVVPGDRMTAQQRLQTLPSMCIWRFRTVCLRVWNLEQMQMIAVACHWFGQDFCPTQHDN